MERDLRDGRRGRARGAAGKRVDAPWGPSGLNLDNVQEGADAQQEITEEKRKTNSRRDLSRNPNFEEISPEVGQLDEQAFSDAMEEDADDALSMLADLTGATDVALRELARQLAGRLVLDLAKSGPVSNRGVGRMRSVPAGDLGGDLDLDASLEPLQLARATETPPALDELVVREWANPETALCILVDRSGSMGGDRLAAAAVAAAACSWRAPEDYSVVAFSDKSVVVKSQDAWRPADAVIDDVFCLRGHGTTDLSLALRTAAAQLDRSRAKRRITILLSDCRPTEGEDPLADARVLDELCIVAPADDAEDADELASTVGARCAHLDGPAAVPAVFHQLLSD